MNSGSGVGIYSEEINLKASENLGEFATVFQTEIVAITPTAREILHRNLNNKKIALYARTVKRLSRHLDPLLQHLIIRTRLLPANILLYLGTSSKIKK